MVQVNEKPKNEMENIKQTDKNKNMNEQDLYQTMQDVIGANSVYSQILYNDFVLMFFSIMSIVVYLINYEINYDKLTKLEFSFDTYPQLLNSFALLFNSFSVVVLLSNIYFRNKLQISFEAYTNFLTHEDTLKTSGYLWQMIMEFIIVLIHPNIFFIQKNYTYKKKILSQYPDILVYSVNEILFTVLFLRLYFVIRYFLTLTNYKSSRAARTCKLYGEKNSYFFAFRCVFNKNPFSILASAILSISLVFSYMIRIYERPFTSYVRNLNYYVNLNFNDELNDYENSFWTSFNTILNNGLGDFAARSWLGRLVTVFEVGGGILLTSLITVALYQKADFDNVESKIFLLLSRINIRKQFEEIQKQLIEKLMYHHYFQFKFKKDKENYDKKLSTNPEPHVILKLEKNMKTWTSKKEFYEFEMKKLVREKNVLLKRLENISTSTYVIESFVDDITGCIDSLEESITKVDEVVKKFNTNLKKDDVFLTNIKRSVTSEKARLSRRRIRIRK